MRRYLALAVLVLLANTAAASAATKSAYDKQPPGKVVQDVTAYLTGEGMHSAWHVVASRLMAGKQMGKTPVYQWYLSFYAPSQNGLKLVYQLPQNGSRLVPSVTKAHGAEMYFPVETVKIVGSGELEQSGMQDVVVQSQAFAADCGSATIAVFGARIENAEPIVEPRATITNPCSLSARIVKSGSLQAVQLNGPYYSPKAALCCPTKPHVTAKLSYTGGKWSVNPGYFTMSASATAMR